MSQPNGNIYEAEIAGLLDDISSPDPLIRDGESLGRLYEILDSPAVSPAQRRRVGSTAVQRLADPRVEVRSFAALVLIPLILHDAAEPGWFDDFATWYATEEETTGYDDVRGWLHAVAHGADVLGAFGWMARESPRPALDLAALRMLHQGPGIWRDQEDDRLGYALAITLANPRLTPDDALSWLDPLEEAFLRADSGPVPAFVSNSIRTLRVVQLLTDEEMSYQGRGVRVRHSTAVGQRIRDVLHLASPWMWNPAGASGQQ
ncbi:MAG: DUF2785 domain-containing protein [Arthrobacter sp.]|uniref:DUF2785 domain-containing protein n=1 Tax=Arthrobacter sp. AOP36-A1-22 TaxID=3457684 RepID=UPI002656B80C|nr:DUF2785 domain-containing protein [Micrococcaceae bacterium]MDN5886545.1 DUF2785 domain-containing protein [Micrococcaceae bacterium]